MQMLFNHHVYNNYYYYKNEVNNIVKSTISRLILHGLSLWPCQNQFKSAFKKTSDHHVTNLLH